MPTIFTYNSKGGKLAIPQRSNLSEFSSEPKMIRARVSADGGVRGSGVVVTNPRYQGNRNKRTQSLGQGAVGQRGRVMDVPGT